MKRSLLSTLSAAAFVLPLGLAACSVESTENNTITGGGNGGTGAKAGAAGSSAGSAGTAGAAAGSAGSAGAAAGSAGSAGTAGAAGAAAGSAGSAGAAAGSAGSAGAAAGSAGSAGAAAGSAGSAGAAAGSAGAGGAAAGAGGSAGAAAGSAGAAGATGGSGGAGGGTAAGFSYLRFAHMLTGVPTAIDICIRPKSASDWTDEKPFFSSQGSKGQFKFPVVSVLAKVAAGTAVIRIVGPDQTDCKTQLNPLIADRDIPVPDGFQGTLVLGGAIPTLAPQIIPDVKPFTDADLFAIQGVHAHAAHPGKIDLGIDGDDPADVETYFVQSVAQNGNDFAKGPIPKGQPRFLISEEGSASTAGTLIVTFPDIPKVADDKLAQGDIFNIFYTSPSTSAKDTMIVCASFDYEAEQAAQAAAKTAGTLPKGDAITSLCAQND